MQSFSKNYFYTTQRTFSDFNENQPKEGLKGLDFFLMFISTMTTQNIIFTEMKIKD